MNNRNIQNLIFVLAICLFIMSCEKEKTEIIPKFIQPLGIGYHWVYADSTFSPYEGFLYSDTSILTVTGKTSIMHYGEETEVYFWSWDFLHGYGISSTVWLCNNSDEGFYIYGAIYEGNYYLQPKSLSIKFPVKINESWDRLNYSLIKSIDSTYLYNTNKTTITCTSVNESFYAGSHNYKCFIYKLSMGDPGDLIEIYAYYSPEVGYIGYKRMYNGSLIFTKTLISYDLTESMTKKSDVNVSNASNALMSFSGKTDFNLFSGDFNSSY